MSTVVDVLKGVLAENLIHVDAASLELYSQDVFGDGEKLGAVVRPASEQDVVNLVSRQQDTFNYPWGWDELYLRVFSYPNRFCIDRYC